jgi:predicted Ser/Thr protein kinase
MSEFIEQADEEVTTSTDPPLSLSEYVSRILAQPTHASQSAKYLLEAIESCGTRETFEDGMEKTRWRFFDDPHGDGEHAVLGNTDILNEFVSDLQRMTREEGTNEEIVWFGGPTATGKSELKRCLVSGLHGYSKTDAGKWYTMEWNVSTTSTGAAGMTYGEGTTPSDDWYESRVNGHPLTVFPPQTRQQILAEVNDDTQRPVTVDESLDPFCQEAYNTLHRRYNQDSETDLFSQITSPRHLRIIRKHVGVGDGIGILHSEDDGSPKERLVGSWMPGVLKEMGSRGRKNPQAFSYDGILSQGNRVLTLVEDASQHADLLQKLLNIPEERMVKLDKEISMDIDTVLVVLSNPDLDVQLNKHAEQQAGDPLKALRRRLDKYEFRYLTNVSSEAELIHREFTGRNVLWTDADEDAPLTQPVTVHGTEFAPRAIEAAALYSVVTRLSEDALPPDLSFVEKALALDRGFHHDGDARVDSSEYNVATTHDGGMGIPITYTKSILGSLSQEHDVVLPSHVLKAMGRNLATDPVFSDQEIETYSSRVADAFSHVRRQQENDILQAILHEFTVDDADLLAYVKQVYDWHEHDDTDDDPRSFSPLELKVFETERLGLFDDSDYRHQNNSRVFNKDQAKSKTEATSTVESFRTDRVINTINNYIWNQKGNFKMSDVPFSALPLFEDIINTNEWDAVQSRYESFDPNQWRNPPEGTQTEQVKETAIENMVSLFAYSDESARRVSTQVLDGISWDDESQTLGSEW